MDKADVLNCALKLFYKKGYNSTSMEDIAYELGIKKASLYYHIKGKQELLYEMIESIGLKVMSKIEEIEKSNDTTYGKLKKSIHAYALTCLENIEYTAIIHDETRSLEDEQRHFIEKLQKDFISFFKEMFSEGISKGYIVDMDVNILTHLVLGTCTWVYKWFKPGEKYSPAEMASMVTDFVMRAIIREPQEPAVTGTNHTIIVKPERKVE
ncbi:MAG: TetR/AcrR family transcriptional regulator [Bacillota bacterium]